MNSSYTTQGMFIEHRKYKLAQSYDLFHILTERAAICAKHLTKCANRYQTALYKKRQKILNQSSSKAKFSPPILKFSPSKLKFSPSKFQFSQRELAPSSAE